MPLLFSYGTLQDERVQLALFGGALVGWKDELLGFEQTLVLISDPEFARSSSKTHHAILKPTGTLDSRVAGMAFELTDAELERADEYEPAEYRRVTARLSSGREAWVYVDATVTGEAVNLVNPMAT